MEQDIDRRLLYDLQKMTSMPYEKRPQLRAVGVFSTGVRRELPNCRLSLFLVRLGFDQKAPKVVCAVAGFESKYAKQKFILFSENSTLPTLLSIHKKLIHMGNNCFEPETETPG